MCNADAAFSVCVNVTPRKQISYRSNFITSHRPRFPTQNAHATRQRSNYANKVTMDWKPAGLLQEAVDIKLMEVELMEETLMDRPDHPINMRRSFFAQYPSHRMSNALRRRDGSLSVMASVKRFQASRPGEPAQLVAPLEDIASEMRALHVQGVDAALFYTDMLRHGIETPELRKAVRGLSHIGREESRMAMARHDIIVDAVQIAEASEAGAVAVNIVAGAALPELMELLNAATMMGIEAIVECHSTLEVDFAMECGATILFLNNWDRSRNELVPGTVEKLIEGVPPFVLTLGGGGLQTASDCWRLLDHGFNGVVLGKTLLQSRRPAAFIQEIRSQKRYSGDMFSGDTNVPFSEGVLDD